MAKKEEKKVTLEQVGVPPKEKETKVVIGRLGSASQSVTVTGSKATVGDALKAAGVELGATEKVWMNGEKASASTLISAEGSVISILSPKQAGQI